MMEKWPVKQRMHRKNIVKELSAVALLCAVAIALCYPLVFERYLFGHDSPSHVLWAQQFLKSLKTGLVDPQWVADANLGCGNATFIFYPPATFFSYALIHFFTEEVLPILNISAILGMMASGIIMYLFGRVYLGRFPALLSAAAFMALPYHLIDLYVRTAMAEFWAFAWIPLIYYSAAKIREDEGVYSAGLSVSYAGLILTHLPTTLISAPFFIGYILFLYYSERNRKLFLCRLAALGVGLCLSSFYLIPAIAEQRYVDIKALTNNAWYWVRYNFLFSRDAYNLAFNQSLSRLAISMGLIALVGLLYRMWGNGRTRKGSSPPGAFFPLAGLVSFVLMLPISRLLWETLPFFGQVQFPWRLLTVTTFFAAISLGFLFEGFLRSFPSRKGWGTVLQGLCIGGLVFLNGAYSFSVVDSFKGVPFAQVRSLRGQNLSIRADNSYDDLLRNFNLFSTYNLWAGDVAEYRPLWSLQKVFTAVPGGDAGKDLQDYTRYIDEKIAKSPATDFSLDGNVFFEKHGSYVIFPPLKILYAIRNTEAAMALPYAMLKERVFFTRGAGSARIVKWEPEARIIHVQAAMAGIILIRTFYYPRWNARINGNTLPIFPDAPTGLIKAEIPLGEYDIELNFEAGVYRIIGVIISLLSAGAVLTFLLRKKRAHPSAL